MATILYAVARNISSLRRTAARLFCEKYVYTLQQVHCSWEIEEFVEDHIATL